ncbi:MAG: multicopper oxidase domain-containing protein [Halobacteriaceae archaeon]
MDEDDAGDGRGPRRRTVLGAAGAVGAAGVAAAGAGGAAADPGHGAGAPTGGTDDHHGAFGTVGEYGGGFDPHGFLRTFNTGHDGQSNLTQSVAREDGRRVREFTIRATDTAIEIAPGVSFAAWAFHGQVPGPTLRVTEGDLVRVHFVNGSAHAHTIHPHLRNLNPRMDGIPQNGPGVLETGESFTYEWLAQPAGVHLYHCHSLPLTAHIHRGLSGALVVDPDPERVAQRPAEYVLFHPSQITPELRDDLVARARSLNGSDPAYADDGDAQELVMVMNGFDTNFDGENEVYAVNTRAFAYGVGSTDGNGEWAPGETVRPIRISRDRPVRVYLVNAIEFDPINSFHTHSQFFDYYDHGTSLVPTHETVDTVMQCQAQRGIVELDYSAHEPGLYMFHAHQSEFAELGWMSFFEVVDDA